MYLLYDLNRIWVSTVFFFFWVKQMFVNVFLKWLSRKRAFFLPISKQEELATLDLICKFIDI